MPKATDAEIANQAREVERLQAQFDAAWEKTSPPLHAAREALSKLVAKS